MPNKPAARKSLRQSKKHAIANRARREAFRTAIKNTLKEVDPKKALELARAAQQALAKAAKTGAIAKNTAARRLSRLMKKIHSKKK